MPSLKVNTDHGVEVLGTGEKGNYKNIADEYNPSLIYKNGSLVFYNGQLYKNIKKIEAPEQWNENKWKRISTSTILGNSRKKLIGFTIEGGTIIDDPIDKTLLSQQMSKLNGEITFLSERLEESDILLNNQRNVYGKIDGANGFIWSKNGAGVLAPQDCSDIFGGFQAKKLDLSNFDTSNVTDMGRMFLNSRAVSLDLSNFNTSGVVNMGAMFFQFDQDNLKKINVSNFDTSKVTNMNHMFAGDVGIKELDVSSFNTSNVTEMGAMFSYSGIISLDLSNFDTSKVINMSDMFSDSTIASLNLSSFITSDMTDLTNMFSNMKHPNATVYCRNQDEINRYKTKGNPPASVKFVIK